MHNTPHKHSAVIKQWADGARIEFKHLTNGWVLLSSNGPTWNVNTEYRVYDKFRELKELHSQGIQIEFESTHVGWLAAATPSWHPNTNYRVKPTPVLSKVLMTLTPYPTRHTYTDDAICCHYTDGILTKVDVVDASKPLTDTDLYATVTYQ